jgi:hypothetical protein
MGGSALAIFIKRGHLRFGRMRSRTDREEAQMPIRPELNPVTVRHHLKKRAL